MASKPILFNTEMVRAILDGRKSMTRRIIKPQPQRFFEVCDTQGNFHLYDVEWGLGSIYPRYQIGDILWVRETWRDRWGMAYANYGTGNAYPIDDVREIEYKAGGNGFFMHGCDLCPDEPTVKWGEWSKWRPSIFMPREAARIFLRVTNVRVERLQEISKEDIIAEGSKLCNEQEPNRQFYYGWGWYFRNLWDSLNAKRGYGWATNPWVWVYEFERVSEE